MEADAGMCRSLGSAIGHYDTGKGDTMTTYSITTFKVKIKVSEDIPKTTSSPKETAALLRAIYAELDGDQEHFCVLALNGNNQAIGYKVLASGGMSFANIDQKLLWRAALTLGGVALIIAHNHPSGNPRPSPEDIALTKTVQEAAKLLDYRLLDHIILGECAGFYSFADEGRL